MVGPYGHKVWLREPNSKKKSWLYKSYFRILILLEIKYIGAILCQIVRTSRNRCAARVGCISQVAREDHGSSRMASIILGLAYSRPA
jgi:hypothetical protein